MYELSKRHFSTNPNRGNILVKLRADGEFIRIRTFDRAHGGSRSFIVRREENTDYCFEEMIRDLLEATGIEYWIISPMRTYRIR